VATTTAAAATAPAQGVVNSTRSIDSIGRWPTPTQRPQLRFTLRGQVELYAFWLTRDARCGSSYGPVAGGGRGYSGGWNYPSAHGVAPCPA
jgi:hypothetical protein